MANKIRCTIKNKHGDGVLIFLPDTFDELLKKGTRLHLAEPSRVYLEGGILVEDVGLIQNNDSLYVLDKNETYEDVEELLNGTAPKRRYKSADKAMQRAYNRVLCGEETENADSDGEAANALTDGISDSGDLRVSMEFTLDDVTAIPRRMKKADGPRNKYLTFKSNHHVADLGEWVSLNVGGTIFQTSRTTLCRDPQSMLYKLFYYDEGAEDQVTWNSTVDQDGAYLFDRDPRYFSIVLSYLRTNKLLYEEGMCLEGVLQEALFFQVQGLQDLVVDALDVRERLRTKHPMSDRYVILTVKSDGLKYIEGPVERVMIVLNGGKLPPRKPPFSKEADVHSRVYGLTELGWMLKNFKLSEVLDALKLEGWDLCGTSSAATEGHEHEHVFVFQYTIDPTRFTMHHMKQRDVCPPL